MSDTKEIRLSILGMNCVACVARIENALAKVNGTVAVVVNFANHTALVSGQINAEALIKAVQDAGYQAVLIQGMASFSQQERQEQERYQKAIKRAIVAALLGVPLMIAGHIFAVLPAIYSPTGKWFWSLIALLTLGALCYAGGHFFRSGWKAIKHGQATMDTLIALGTGSAWIYSSIILIAPEAVPTLSRNAYFEATVLILAFINFGTALELRARGRTSNAIRQLIGLQPQTACVVKAGQEQNIALKDVNLGDILRVKPGEKIAVDGIVIEGSSTVDESMLTGEATAVKKQTDAKVVAGTINERGSFLFKATHIGQNTALAQIIASVQQAQSTKPEIAKLVDKVSSIFVPIVVAIAAITFITWYMFGPEPQLGYAFVTSMTVLVIACPCALGLATPISVMVAVGRAAQLGILIKRGMALQEASKITCVIVDKTGTVTEGKPSVVAIMLTKSLTEAKVLQLAASIELNSEHSLASAILTAAKQRQLELLPTHAFVTTAGQGVSATINGQQILLGNQALMAKHQVSYQEYSSQIQKYYSRGQTAMILAVDNNIVAIIAVADAIKSDSALAIQQLVAQNIRVIMVTGDNTITAQVIAQQIGISELHAQVLPQDKATIVKKLQQAGEMVAMIGDGINDAPALAQANVGFAIGAGTDVAIESADIVLLQSSLLQVPAAIKLSQATLTNIKQNLFGAFIYNTLSIPVASGLFFPFFGILLNPMLAGAAMAISSLTVVSNANRLRHLKLK